MRPPIIAPVEAEKLRRYTRVKFPEFTDAELARHSFWIDDLSTIPNLTEEEPPIDQDLTFVGEYKLADNIRCVFGHHHKWGFIFRDEQGRHYPIGNECGSRLLGNANWQDFGARQRSLNERASYLRQLFALKATLAEHRDWIAGLSKSPAIAAFHAIREDISEYPDLAEAARKVFAKQGGELSLITKVRDRDAEGKREEQESLRIAEYEKKLPAEQADLRRRGLVPQRSNKAILRERVVSGGTIVGRVLFAAQPSATEAYMTGLVRKIDGFLALDKMPTEKKAVQSISNNMRDIVQRLIGVRDDINDAIAFFERDNLERFSAWANQNRFHYSRYRVGNRLIEIEHIDDGETDSIIAYDDLSSLDDLRFDLLNEASRAFGRQFEVAGR